MPPFRTILSFHSELASSAEHSLALVGGKGANLAKLFQAGFPVPEGFLVTTRAYRDFVAANRLAPIIAAALPAEDHPDAQVLEQASSIIRRAFSDGQIPPNLAEEIVQAYQELGEGSVAVRSSATAEDLPEMSFAGQQDTFLNILGERALLEAVVDCWSSLWTARAIGYRLRNHVPHSDIALGVIVQRLVESQASGVLFTANPLTGLRSETVSDATFGLGEALVSGQVEPDHYVVDSAKGIILEKTLGAKTLSIHGRAGGGTLQTLSERKALQALPDTEILALARMGQSVEALTGSPQDIEWAWSQQRLYLLQARPITSLFPLPEGASAEPLKIFCSFAAVQGLMDPITPVGRETIQLLFAAGASIFGYRLNAQTQGVLHTAGERLWINTTPLFRNSTGRMVMRAAFEFTEPTIKQAMLRLWNEPRLLPERRGIRLGTALRLAQGFLPILGNLILNLISPRKRREGIVRQGEQILDLLRKQTAGLQGTPREKLSSAANLLPDLADRYLPMLLIHLISLVAAGVASLNLTRLLSGDTAGPGADGWGDLVLETTRGLPNNPTTEMDLKLWNIARTIRNDPELLAEFRSNHAVVLAARCQAGQLSPAVQTLIDRFLQNYGGRGLGEVDLGRPRWSEDPTHVFEALSSYLQIEQEEMAPDMVFSKGEASALQAIDRLALLARSKRGGWFRARAVRFFGGRLRELLGSRENPKFFMVRLFAELRTPLLEIGNELCRSGDIDQADDLFFLTFTEMKAFARNLPEDRAVDWKKLIAGRRQANRREAMRRQIPRLLVSDGRAFYEGIQSPAAGGNTLAGSPVSPGRAEGTVRVVLDPRQANLKPGEILVCPGTDPSWTPLFLSAAGLVMEVGGLMTHGAVVAREYGIPAVVGVDQATHRLSNGQKICIDGSSGVIEILD